MVFLISKTAGIKFPHRFILARAILILLKYPHINGHLVTINRNSRTYIAILEIFWKTTPYILLNEIYRVQQVAS